LATRLAIAGGRGSWPPRPRTSRTQHSCGLRRPHSAEQGGCARNSVPAGPATRSFPAPWPFEVRRAHLLQGRGQLGSAHGRGGSSGDSPFSGALRRGSGGPWDGASAPSPFSWDSRVLIPFVPRPTSGPRPGRGATAVSRRARPASHQTGRLPGLRPRTPVADSWSPDSGVSSWWLAPSAPVRPRLAGRPVAQCLTKRLTSKTSLVCSMG
jgi:hypothetical protein